MGASWAILGASWAVLSRRRAEKAQMPKSFNNQGKINDFGLFGLSWRTSWRPLGPSGRPLGGLLGRLGPSWTLLGRFGGRLGPSRADLEAILGHLHDFLRMPRAKRPFLGFGDGFSEVYGWPAGRAEAHWGVLLEKEPKPKLNHPARRAPLWQDHRGRRIEDAYGESPPPPAFLEAPMWPNVEARPAKLSDHVFPESVWKAFGEHVGILKVILAVLEASWASFGRSLGLFGPSRASFEPTSAILVGSWHV